MHLKTSKVKSFLNSYEWVKFQRSLGRKVFHFEEQGIEANIIRYDSWLGSNYLYIPHGPTLNNDSDMGDLVHRLKALAKSEGSFAAIAEPIDDHVAQALIEAGFKKSSKHIQPAKTVVLDITQTETELQEAMHHKTRYNIHVAEHHGIDVKQSQDIDVFWKLLQKTTQRDSFSSHPYDYYVKLFKTFDEGHAMSIKLFIAHHNNVPVAAALVLIYEHQGIYLHGASDYDYRKYMAPYMLHWRIIQDLKAGDCQSYDFWGIDEQRYPGVTRFKLQWGGQVVERPGAFELSLRPLLFYIYKIIRKLRNL